MPYEVSGGCIFICAMANHENISDDPPYALPSELLQEVREAEADLRKSVQHIEGRYLVYRQTPILEFPAGAGRVEITGADLLQFLQPLVKSIALDSAEGRGKPPRKIASLKSVVARKILDFIMLEFEELRALICKDNKKKFPLSAKTTVAIAGLTHWAVDHMGVKEEFAKSIATSILVAVLTATKGAFCKMTAKEAMEALERAS